MTGCCTLPPREAPAIPLWINGRPVLAMSPVLHEIRETATQRLIRRVPMVGQELAATAIEAASRATRLAPEVIRSFLDELLEALGELEAHFAGLSAVETGTHLDTGKADVAHAIDQIRALQAGVITDTALQQGVRLCGETILAMAGPGMPLSAAVQLVLPIILQSGAVTLVPDANAPACALALVELCGQCGLPDGVFNLIYVENDVAATLVQNPELTRVRLFGPSAWAQRWQTAAMNWSIPCELVLA